ncbi:chromate efflux transporter [Hymenobacter wooponensis]|uniref:Chromate efflux transporter n=1 Tax=Hymenobacter wooponensis TaxID=1525360 RepID=A0A4Z0MMT9_9BACT|nr:chromate efflux transporter [Hymenobacter wooponensis]TGD80696.1 chromate efflux transporter [Hymenobacter wooponensis]
MESALPVASADAPAAAPVSFREAFRFWLKLGFISFGGPAGQIAIMHEYVVERRRWLEEDRFLHALNYCMLLPGPEAQQLATYIGWLLHGVRGGLVAGSLFVLPSVCMLLGLSWAYVAYGTVPAIAGLLYGLKPAVVAIVLGALLKIGEKALKTPLHVAVAGLSFLALFLGHLPFPVVVFGALLLGLVVQRWRPIGLGLPTSDSPGVTPAKASAGGRHWPMYIGKALIVALGLWVIPVVAAGLFTGDWAFWWQLTRFFSTAALVTFGGAYAVLPYVAQVAVEQFHWLTRLQMVDGLALGETTPGPLIMVLTFVGFMGAWQHGGHSVGWGAAGLLLTTFYTFLPSFFFIFVGAPLVERTRQDARVKAALSVVTGAVVGVILNLGIYLGQAVVWPQGIRTAPDWFCLVWVTLSILALRWGKVNLILWIGVSALAGLAYSWLL